MSRHPSSLRQDEVSSLCLAPTLHLGRRAVQHRLAAVGKLLLPAGGGAWTPKLASDKRMGCGEGSGESGNPWCRTRGRGGKRREYPWEGGPKNNLPSSSVMSVMLRFRPDRGVSSMKSWTCMHDKKALAGGVGHPVLLKC